MKRTLSFEWAPETAVVLAGTGLVASTYGLVRLAYGLLLPDVQAALGMSEATAGYVASGASVAYCVGALCGLLARDHARALVVAALGTASLGALGTVVAGGVPVFSAATVLASTGAGLASPALVAVVAALGGRAPSGPRPGDGELRHRARPRRGRPARSGAAPPLARRHGRRRRRGRGHRRRRPAARPPWRGPPRRRCERGRPGCGGWPCPRSAALLLGTASAAVWTYGRAQVVAGGAGDAASTLAWIALGAGGALTVVTAGQLAAWPATRAWALTAVVTAGATAAVGAAAGSTVLATLACAVFGWGFVAASSALIVWAGELVPERAAPGTALLFITLVLGQAIGSALAGAVAGSVGADLGVPRPLRGGSPRG